MGEFTPDIVLGVQNRYASEFDDDRGEPPLQTPLAVQANRPSPPRSARLMANLASVALLLLAGDFTTGLARGQQAPAPAVEPSHDALAPLRAEIHQLRLDLWKARALGEELADEERVLGASEAGDFRTGRGGRLSTDEPFWEKHIEAPAVPRADLKSSLDASEMVLREVEKELQGIKTAESDALRAWDLAVQADLAFQERRAITEDRAGRSWDDPGVSSTFGSLALPVAIGFVAIAVGLIFTLHETRRRLRWRLRALGSQPSASAMVGLLCLTLGVGQAVGAEGLAASRDREREELTLRRDELRAELDTIQKANAEIARRLDDRLGRVRRARATFGFWPRGTDKLARAEEVIADTEAAHASFRALRVAARTTKGVEEATALLRRETSAAERTLGAFLSANRQAAGWGGVLRLSILAGMAAVALGPLLLVRRRAKRKLNLESRLCPQCEALDTVRVPDASEYDDEREAMEDESGPKIQSRLAVCGECEYEIRENYLRQYRLSIPTLGVRGSGKSHWATVLYDQIKNANLTVASSLRKLPSPRQDAVFDDLVRQLYKQRTGLTGTNVQRLRPLVFHVKDADPLGPNKTTLNLFDASGELSQYHIDRDERRLRLLRCQGFTLFLDPTQVIVGPWSENDQTIADQIDTLTHFSEELHAVRGVPTEQPVDLPIAVCVTKLDLVITQNPIGSQALPFVSELRETIGRDIDLGLIHERSQICARALPLLFPGWNVERSLREQFGGRYMFFPMSPVGLEEHELGQTKLADRSFTPFGVLEPLLWLLHMHGYCVLR